MAHRVNRKLIDFLDPRLSENCKIYTNGVSDDHCTLDNLISTDAEKRSRGFMAYSASHPPIEITLEFSWKINLKMIKIYSVLSSLKSTRFQIFVKCHDTEQNEFFRKINETSLNEDQIGLCLKAGYVDEPVEDSLKEESVYPYALKSLKSISVIKIVVADTKLRRAPVIKKLEVYGIPSFSNSREEIVLINRLLDITPESSTVSQVYKDTIIKRTEVDTSFNIPEDFLDSITHELLVMPFILPSGNIIDETTLTKHNKHEASYGRLPSDPFTGLIYTSDSQPKFNDLLKLRLDAFKLRNSQELEVKQSGRTLGRKHEEPSASTSSYAVSNGHVSKKIKFSAGSSSDLDSIISSIYKNKQVSIFTQPRECRDESKQECCDCQSPSSTNLYGITCCHLFCKPCLLKLNEACGVCNRSFLKADVKKLNL